MSRSHKEKQQQQQKYPDLILSKAASNLLKLSQKEKTNKHKEAAKTLLSLHKKATKKKQDEKRPDIFDLKAAELLQKVSKKAATQVQQKEKTEKKLKHEQAAQSLLSLSSQNKPKKWKTGLMKKHNK